MDRSRQQSSRTGTPRHPGRVTGFLLALALALVLPACGVDSSSNVPAFQIAGVGPGGGVVAAGDVRLTLASGALAQTTAVSILPQATPFPIQVPPQDPCTYSYLGPLWCCGPVGQDLLVPSVLRIYYDENLIPAGFTEADLVLLQWNNTLQVMQPNLSATQNTALNYFEDTNYLQLGHVAVGIRDCQGAGNIVVAGNNVAQGAISNGVYLIPIDASTQLFLSGELPFQFVPSQAGGRILMSLPGPNEATLLGSVPLTGGATTTVVDAADNLDLGDPFFGWMRQTPFNRAWFFQFRPGSLQNVVLPQVLDPTQDQSVLARRNGDASDAIFGIHGISTSAGFVIDVRQSPTGNHYLIRYGSFSTGQLPDTIEVIETTTGNIVSSGIIPPGGGQHTPRFTPDGSGIYGVSDDQQSVIRYDLDGSNPQTIFSFGPGEVVQNVEDAVISPSGQLMTVIVRGASVDFLFLVQPDVPMQGIVLDTFNLGTQSTYDDIFWNPVAQDVCYVAERTNVRPYQMDPAAAIGSRITQHPLLPVSALRLMDVDAATGELLHLTQPPISIGDTLGLRADDSSTASTQGPGVCVTDAIGGNLRIVPPFGLSIYAARWQNTFRATPGMSRSVIR